MTGQWVETVVACNDLYSHIHMNDSVCGVGVGRPITLRIKKLVIEWP